METRDLLLANGTIVDGSGAPARAADVLITGGRIAAIGSLERSERFEIVDCAGLHLAPGFIDVHSHSDQEILRGLSNKILQGVTTEIVGNCGFSLFPTHPNPQGLHLTGEIFDGEPPEGMDGAAQYFSALEQARPLVNTAALTGHAALRIYVMKVRWHPDENELRQLEAALDRCLGEGSIGFSTGLNCMPSSFGSPVEIERLCRVTARRRAFYTTHMRDYKFKVVEAVDEAIAAARASGAPLQISHMQVVGKKNWHRLDTAIEHIERARSEGVDVAMDAYPYLAGSCCLVQFLPTWCQEGGSEKLLEHLSSPAAFDRIARETDDYMSNSWDDLMICEVRTGRNRPLVGQSIARVAAGRDRPAPETALELLREEGGYLYVISFNNNEENLRKVLTHPLASVITDGVVMEGMTHPRTYGTYPKFFGEYVRDKGWMTMEEAVVKTSAAAARRFHLAGRGTLERGNHADVAIFDFRTIGTDADYLQPDRQPRGIRHVLVNGQFAVRDGKTTGVRAGAILRRAGPSSG